MAPVLPFRLAVARRSKPTRYTKSTLPEKTCPVCGRPFAWRKKWARVWDEVVYCSERCRRNRSARTPGRQGP